MKKLYYFSNIKSFIINILIFSILFLFTFNFISIYAVFIFFIPSLYYYINSKPLFGFSFSIYSILLYLLYSFVISNSFYFSKTFTDIFIVILTFIFLYNIIMLLLIIKNYKTKFDLLSKSEENYRILSSLPTNGIIIYSNDKIIETNSSIISLLGYSKEEFLSLPLSAVIAPDSYNLFNKINKLGNNSQFESILLKKDCTEVPAILYISNIKFNGISAKSLTIYDITSIKTLEKNLLYFKKAIEYSPASIVITDLDGNIEYVNPAFTNKTGYTFKEALGENPRILKNKDKPSEEYDILWKTILAGKTWHGEFYNTKKNGEHYWELASISPIIDNNNKTRAFIAVKEDITLRKLMEEELVKSKERAERANHDKSKFVLYVSHEIRNPISGVLSIVNLLLNVETDSEKIEFLHLIKHSANALLEIVNNILDISKLESGKMEIQNINFSIPDTLNNITSLFSVISKNKELYLNCFIDEKIPPVVFGDYLKLQQIIINLVSNSLKFTEKGGITIKADCKTISEKNTTILFTIEDTGIGIPDAMKDAIFESFTQVDTVITRKEKGTGLGLTLVKKMVEILNGKLSLESKKHIGTKFFIELDFKLHQ